MYDPRYYQQSQVIVLAAVAGVCAGVTHFLLQKVFRKRTVSEIIKSRMESRENTATTEG